MTNDPLLLLLMFAGALFIAKLWWGDLKNAEAGQPNPRAFPGAVRPTRAAVLIATVGALVLLAVETMGENALGLTAEQSTMTWLFGLYTLVAPVLEELIFRGYLVVENRGRATLWAAAIGASLVFALIHPFLWSWGDEGFAITWTAKGVFSTAMAFSFSLWMYVSRFAAWNANRSLLPCVIAHAAKNLGVFGIKYAQGFVGGLW